MPVMTGLESTSKMRTYLTDELKIPKEEQPVVIYHAPSAIDNHNPTYKGGCHNADFKSTMNMFRSHLKSWPFITQYLDFWDESVMAHRVGCTKDGMHFLGECSHNTLLVQWDFNWLKKLNIIDSFTSDGKRLP